jgi:biopolymer transport protein ExbD
MRRTTPYAARRSELEIKMTPMIDVVFLLLIFFVWTASFQKVEYVLPSNLASVVGAAPAQSQDVPPPPEEDFDQVVIRIQWQNGKPLWKVNDLVVTSLQQVRRRLETIARIQRDSPIILHPDPVVPLGTVIDVYDVTRLVGFEEIQFAASENI